MKLNKDRADGGQRPTHTMFVFLYVYLFLHYCHDPLFISVLYNPAEKQYCIETEKSLFTPTVNWFCKFWTLILTLCKI